MMPFHFLRKYPSPEFLPVAEFLDVAMSFDWFPDIAEDISRGVSTAVGDLQKCEFQNVEGAIKSSQEVKFVSDPYPYGENYKEFVIPRNECLSYLAEACRVYMNSNSDTMKLQEVISRIEKNSS